MVDNITNKNNNIIKLHKLFIIAFFEKRLKSILLPIKLY